MIRNVKYLLLTLLLTLTLSAHAQTGFAISETSEPSEPTENTESAESSESSSTSALQEPSTPLGRLTLLSFQEKRIRIRLVSVNCANLHNCDDVEARLNEIFRAGVVRVDVDDENTILNVAFERGATLTHGGSGLLTVYSDDELSCIREYEKALGEAGDDEYVLFYVDQALRLNPEGTRQEVDGGYMPLGYHYGFIFGLPNINCVAHEIAHGAFTLKHSFEAGNQYLGAQMSTTNLMDYALGTTLHHKQWYLMHHPEHNFLKFLQKEEEGEMEYLKEELVGWESVSNYLITTNNSCAFIRTKKKTETKQSDGIVSSKKFFENYEYLLGCFTSTTISFSNIINLQNTSSFDVTEVKNVPDLTQSGSALYVGIEGRIYQIAVKETDYAEFAETDIIELKDNETFTPRLLEDILKSHDSVVTSLLKELAETAGSMSGQQIEFIIDGKAYFLRDGELIVSSLTDEDLNAGNWSEPVDNIFRFESGDKGELRLRAFGFRDDMPIAVLDGEQKSADLQSLSSDIRATINGFLHQQTVSTAQPHQKPTTALKDCIFPDGKEVTINTDVSCLKLV